MFKFNMLSKRSSIFTLLLLCFSLSFLSSCGDDDDEVSNDSSNAFTKCDYIEVTFRGKTYKENIYPIYILDESYSGDFFSTWSTIDVFSNSPIEVMYGLVHETNLQRVLNSKPGNYRIIENIPDDFSEEEIKNFDFNISVEGRNSDYFYNSTSGVNKVTSIKKAEIYSPLDKILDAAVVEGSFDATLEELNSYDTEKVTGRYRISIMF